MQSLPAARLPGFRDILRKFKRIKKTGARIKEPSCFLFFKISCFFTGLRKHFAFPLRQKKRNGNLVRNAQRIFFIPSRFYGVFSGNRRPRQRNRRPSTYDFPAVTKSTEYRTGSLPEPMKRFCSGWGCCGESSFIPSSAQTRTNKAHCILLI